MVRIPPPRLRRSRGQPPPLLSRPHWAIGDPSRDQIWDKAARYFAIDRQAACTYDVVVSLRRRPATGQIVSLPLSLIRPGRRAGCRFSQAKSASSKVPAPGVCACVYRSARPGHPPSVVRIHSLCTGSRPHSGKYCFGKTPMQTFLDSLPLAKEKTLNQTVQTTAAVA